MNKYLLIGLVAGVVVLAKIDTEYNAIKNSLRDVRKQVLQSLKLADDAGKTLALVNRTIEDLRAKLLRLEMSSELSQQQATELTGLLEQEQQKRIEAEQQAASSKQSLELIRDSPANKVGPIGPKITMHSGANCEPCKRWKRDEMHKWTAKGWQVEVIEETSSKKLWPWFEICEGGRCYEVTGLLTAETYSRAKAAK